MLRFRSHRTIIDFFSFFLFHGTFSLPLSWHFLSSSFMALSLFLFHSTFSLPLSWHFLSSSFMALSLFLFHGTFSLPLSWHFLSPQMSCSCYLCVELLLNVLLFIIGACIAADLGHGRAGAVQNDHAELLSQC